MTRKFSTCLLLLLCLLYSFNTQARPTNTLSSNPIPPKGLRISILTGGPGDELYSLFGHSAIRIIDSTLGTDQVYNYGVFNFSTPNFYLKFTLGSLLYYIDKGSYEDFVDEFKGEQRTVQEQVLDLKPEDKIKIRNYLETNLLPENRSYHYNFLNDNCATRVRNIFPKVLGKNFKFSEVGNAKNQTFRQALNTHLAGHYWVYFGINLLLGQATDRVMTNEQSMFLPEYLHDGMAKATLEGKTILSSDNYLLSHSTLTLHRLDGPLWLTIGIFVLVLLSFHLKEFRYLKGILQFLVLFASGLLGCFLLFMWLGTEHTAFEKNFNVLWAFPPNILIAFLFFKPHRWLKIYALVAMILILSALIISVIGIQQMPIFELIPFLLCLLYIYTDLWKRNSLNPVSKTN